MRETVNQKQRIIINETALRRAVRLLMNEEAPAEGADSNPSYDQIKQASLSGFANLAKDIIKRELVAGGPSGMINPGTIENLIGSGPGDNLGLISFPTNYELVPGNNKKYETARDLANDLITATKSNVDTIASWTAQVVSNNLDAIFPNGVLIRVTLDGKLTGDTINIPPIQFIYFSPLQEYPSQNLEQSSQSMKSQDVRKYIRILVTQEFENLKPTLMSYLNDKGSEAWDWITNATKKEPEKIKGLTIPTASGVQEVSLDFSKIGAASRAAVAAGSGAAELFVLRAGPLADAANDIAESIGGGRFKFTNVKNPFDFLQTRDDLIQLAEALIQSYDLGLIVKESAESAQAGVAEDALRFTKDQEAGLFAAVYTAANITSNRKLGIYAFTTVAALSIGGSAVKAYFDYSAAAALTTTEDSLFWTKVFGGVARWWRKGSPERAEAAAIKAATKAKKGEYAVTRAGEAAKAKAEAEVIELENSTWSSIFSAASARRRELSQASRDAIAARIDALMTGLDPDIRDQIAMILIKSIDDSIENGDAALIQGRQDFMSLMSRNGFKKQEYSKLLDLFDVKYLKDEIEPMILAIGDEGDQGWIMRKAANSFSFLDDVMKKTGLDDSSSLDAVIAAAQKDIKDTVLKELSNMPEFKSLSKKINWGIARELSLGVFVSLLFAEAFGRGLMKAKASDLSSIVTQTFTRLNLPTASGEPAVARNPESYKQTLSFDGTLTEEAQDLIDDIAFLTAKQFSGTTEFDEIVELVGACKAVMQVAVNCDFTGAPEAIGRLRTARNAVQ